MGGDSGRCHRTLLQFMNFCNTMKGRQPQLKPMTAIQITTAGLFRVRDAVSTFPTRTTRRWANERTLRRWKWT